MHVPSIPGLKNVIVALFIAALAVATTVVSVLADGTGGPYPH
jgi:hypothetical protein